jgi:transmembrane sensor
MSHFEGGSDPVETGIELALRIRACDTEANADALTAWVTANPAHVADLWAGLAAWDGLETLANEADVIAWRRQAFSELEEAAVRPKRPWQHRWAVGSIAACFLLAVVSAVTLFVAAPSTDMGVTYANPPGQRSTINLADGSTVVLDEDSEIDVHLSSASRTINLVRGQARFTVKHDGRPFLVNAMDHQVRAVGTSFNVDSGRELQVGLLEGKVTITPLVARESWLGESIREPDQRQAIPLAAGEELVFGPGHAPVLTRFDETEITAWEHGYLVFAADTLEKAVARVNRYAPKKIALASGTIGREEISGVFHTGDSTAFIRSVLALYPHLRAHHDAAGRIVLSRG